MAPSASPAFINFTATATSTLASGWVSQPDGRGTLAILQSCLITLALCSWSVLFLNVPAERDGHLSFLMTKARWMLFTIFFPEMLTGVAAEQWRSACQSVEDFYRLENKWKSALQSSQSSGTASQAENNLSRLKAAPWTMRHAFLADMGGIHLSCPDFTPFPINSHQLGYLVEESFLEYPDLKVRTIWEKNKADGFARTLTLVQIGWFLVQSIARCVQHQALSTLELSTLAFIFCTINTFFFWRHKPLDVTTPIVLLCKTKVEDMLVRAGDGPFKRYSRTPLDHVKPPNVQRSLIAPYWFGFKVIFNNRGKERRSLPVKTFENSQINPPRGLKVADVAFGTVFIFIYFGIHLMGWEIPFSILDRADAMAIIKSDTSGFVGLLPSCRCVWHGNGTSNCKIGFWQQ